MENITFFYFHGFSSSGHSRTAELLREAYPTSTVVCPSYNTKNAYDAISSLTIEVVNNAKNNNFIVLVGTSLGGFFANYFSNRLKIPAVLINPCLDPVNLLQKHNPEHDVDCNSFSKYYLNDRLDVPKTVVLGREDDVIPYNTFLDRLSNYHVFIKENMGHRVSNISEIKDAVDEILNNSYL